MKTQNKSQLSDEIMSRLVVVEKRLSILENACDTPSIIEGSKMAVLNVKKPPNAFFTWLKTNTLMKVGAALLLIGAAWFVSYAFANNWIGPIGRISLGLIVGALILFFGQKQIPKRDEVGQVLVATGGIMMLFTLYAARHIYEFFTSPTTLVMMSLVIITMAVIAIIHRSKSLAYLALIGGALAPAISSSGSENYIGLMSYIFALNIGVFLTAWLRGWRGLITTTVLITGAYSLLAFDYFSDPTAWLFMALFFIQFMGSVTAAVFKSNKITNSDVISVGVTGLLMLYWVTEYVPEVWVSIVLSALVLAMLGLGHFFGKKEGLKKAVYLTGALGLLFLGVATSFELSGAKLVTAYAIEVFLAIFLTSHVLKKKKDARAVSLVQLVPAYLGYNYLKPFDSLLSAHFFAVLSVSLSILATALLLRPAKQEDKSFIPMGHLIVGIIFAVGLIWYTLHFLIVSENVARSASLVIFTLIGLAIFVKGVVKENKKMRIAGSIALTLVVFRLIGVEIWDMTLVARIVTFAAIGILLISTAFFQKSHNH